MPCNARRTLSNSQKADAKICPKSENVIFLQLWELISLEPDAAQNKYEYLRNQDKEIFQTKSSFNPKKIVIQIFGQMAYGGLASAFNVLKHI